MILLCAIAFASSTEPVYSWVHISQAVGRKLPADPLESRRVVEGKLQTASGRRRGRLLLRSAALLVAASDTLWVEQLRRLDGAWALGEEVELDTEDADSLRDEALRRYEKSIELGGPWVAEAHLAAGLLRRERRDLSAAAEHLSAVIEGPGPRRLRRTAAVELGELQFESGDVSGALAAYRTAQGLQGSADLQAYAEYRMGWCQFTLGDHRSATRSLVRAARRSKDSALAEAARRDAIRMAAEVGVSDALGVVDALCENADCVDQQRTELAELLDEQGRAGAAAEVRALGR